MRGGDCVDDLTLLNIWNRVLAKLISEHDIEPLNFEIFEQSKLVEFDDSNNAIVTVDGEIEVIYFYNYVTILEAYLLEITGSNFKIVFKTESDYEKHRNSKNAIIEKSIQKHSDNTLIDKYTFENFIRGQNNADIYRAGLMVADRPGQIFNPLFIFGNSGLGKTHIAHAIGNKIKSNKPNMDILYVTANTFKNDFVSMTNPNSDVSKEWFDNKYNMLDVLIIDDIQFFENATKTQESFFNVYNKLFLNSKQIIITSDVIPKHLNGLEERLVTRFSEGLSVEIKPPEFDTRVDIIKAKLKIHTDVTIDVPDAVLNYMAENFFSNVREIEGAVTTLAFHLVSNNIQDVTLDVARDAFMSIKPSKVDGDLTPEKILNCVCKYYNITKSQIVSNSRLKKLTVPRQIAIYLTRELLQTTYNEIGSLYGNRNHATIISSYNKIEQKITQDDKTYIIVVNEIKELLKT